MVGFRERNDRVLQAPSPGRSSLLSVPATLLALCLAAQPATAARNVGAPNETRIPVHVTGKGAPAKGKAQYAIEFRSRYALSYGHTFIMYGRLNAKGELVDRVVAGLHPAGDSANPWLLGHLVPVVSETGPSDGDLEDEYVSARYRVVVDEAEFKRVVTYIKYKQAHSATWHAIFNNCSGWVADVGAYMGLKSPNPLMMPANFINGMKFMNEGNTRAGAKSLAAAE